MERASSTPRIVVLLIETGDERLPGPLAGTHDHLIMTDSTAARMAVDYLIAHDFNARWVEVPLNWRCDECGRYPSAVAS